MKKLRHLEGENRRLKQLMVKQSRDIQALKAANEKTW